MTICNSCGQPIIKPNYVALIHFGPEGTARLCRKCYRPGFRTEGILTRNAQRVTWQQDDHAGDLVPPHIYDRTSGKQVLNPEFVKLYPDKLHYYMSPSEIKAAGYPKLGKVVDTKLKETASKKEALDKRVQKVEIDNE